MKPYCKVLPNILTDASFDLKNVSLHVEININYD